MADGIMGPQGPRGPRGVPGPAGPAGPATPPATYTHTQGTASSLWIVNHNLGGVVTSVRVLLPGGVEIEADVQEVSNNQTRIYFAAPYMGSAVISL